MSSDVLLSLYLVFQLQESFGLPLNNCTTLCPYCREGQQDWIRTSSPWQLVVKTDDIATVTLVTDFTSPAAAYIAQDYVRVQLTVDSYWYTIEYAGISVGISTNDIANSSAAILDGQYVQADIGYNMTVAGLLIQGGYCLDVNDSNLIDPLNSWVTSLAISYSLDGAQFSWVYDFDGNIQVYGGNTDSSSEVVVSLPQAVTARYWRLHPLTASNSFGNTRQALLRFNIVQCFTAAPANQECVQPAQQCLLADWSTWGECKCFWDGCRAIRTRHVMLYPSCGGLQCDSLVDVTSCLTLSQSAGQWSGIGAACLVTVVISCWLGHRQYKQHKNRKVKVEDAQQHESEKTDKSKHNAGESDEVRILNEKQAKKKQLQELKKQQQTEKRLAQEQKKEAQKLEKKKLEEQKRLKEQQKLQKLNKKQENKSNPSSPSVLTTARDVNTTAGSLDTDNNDAKNTASASVEAAATPGEQGIAAAAVGKTSETRETNLTGAKAAASFTETGSEVVVVASALSATVGDAAASPAGGTAAGGSNDEHSQASSSSTEAAAPKGFGEYASYRRPSKLPPLPSLALKVPAPTDEDSADEEDEEDEEPWPAGSGVHDGEDRWRKAQQLGSWRVGGSVKKTRGSKKARDHMTSSLPAANRRASMLPKLTSFQS